MPQSRGAQVSMIMQRESTFRTPPSPAARQIPFTTANLGRNTFRQENNTVSAQPLPAKRDKGDQTPSGNVTSVFDLRSIGNWLALLLGVPAANKHVTQQPTNVTGVTAQYAEAAAPNGAGTLAWNASGTTLTWTASGESAGSPVNVSAGGNFLLPSGTANHGLYVTVTPASLPGSNQNDTNINVSATLKAHTFPIDLADRPSALLELQHTGIGKYYRFLGSKVSQLSYDLMANDQNINLSLIMGVEVDPVPGAAFDANPTSYAQFRACSALCRITDGNGTGLGSIRSGSLSFDNRMQGIPLAEGGEGYGTIDQADLLISGTIGAMFTGGDAYQLARDNTSTRMRLVSGATIGGLSFAQNVDLLDVELGEPTVTIEGKSGLWVECPFNAHNNGNRRPVITLVNDVASF